MKGVIERIELVSNSDMPILILGETGTGKELIARKIHDRSSRDDRPFLRIYETDLKNNVGIVAANGKVHDAFLGAIRDLGIGER